VVGSDPFLVKWLVFRGPVTFEGCKGEKTSQTSGRQSHERKKRSIFLDIASIFSHYISNPAGAVLE